MVSQEPPVKCDRGNGHIPRQATDVTAKTQNLKQQESCGKPLQGVRSATVPREKGLSGPPGTASSCRQPVLVPRVRGDVDMVRAERNLNPGDKATEQRASLRNSE